MKSRQTSRPAGSHPVQDHAARSTLSRTLIAGSLFLAAAVSAAVSGASAPPEAERAATILGTRCLSCHGAGKKTAGVDLSSRKGAAAAGATAPDDPNKNRLVQVITSGRMPPTGKLSPAEVAALRAWVRAGAAYPREPLAEIKLPDQPLWSLAPVRRPAIPKTPFDALSSNPIDRFVFQKLAEKGLRPSPPASPLALIRRVTMDLTGLPPTPEEVDQFVREYEAERRVPGPASRVPRRTPTNPGLRTRDPGLPAAYEHLVDRLLASPRYGERWARHWLDVVRYGESHGYEQNHLRPNAWPYRDYVIRALNEDRPYDRFIHEQLAGDVLAKGDPATEAATGFLVAGVHDTVGNQTEEGTRQKRANDLDDIVATTAEAFLGLTVGCAKCHDHKFDPIPQRDYYRLAAVFSGVQHAPRTLSRGAGAESAAPAGNRFRHTFAPVTARFLRFTVTATADGSEPCLDELEAYGPDGDANLALASAGSKASASSLLPGYPIHQVPHLNDGLLGNDHSWISAQRGTGWVQIEFPRPVRLDRVVWSRDGLPSPRFADRIPSNYRIEVSPDSTAWQEVFRTGPAPQPGSLAGLQAYVGQFTAPEPVFVLKRGDVMQRGEEATPGALSRLAVLPGDFPTSPEPGISPEAARRLALARWLTDPKNPLTARVMVNRVWQHHFGRGLVATPSDFGHNGEPPTHPELLDYLAARFAGVPGPESRVPSQDRSDAGPGTRDPGLNWSLKSLHRLIVTSYTYRQASAAIPAGVAADAGNQFLWRMPLQRGEAEAIRDAILQTSGKLDLRMGGPSFQLFKYRTVNVAIYEPLEQYGPETWRRSIYQQAARGIRDELLGTFDCPESAQRSPRRPSTTTALQALSLLNGPFITQQANFFAERVEKESPGPSLTARVERAFRLAFGRLPTADEIGAAVPFAASQGLPALCRALLNANEFLYY